MLGEKRCNPRLFPLSLIDVNCKVEVIDNNKHGVYHYNCHAITAIEGGCLHGRPTTYKNSGSS